MPIEFLVSTLIEVPLPMNRRRTKSREFELLTSRIEAALAPTGARIKSPDRIRDKISGQFREVDASIRYAVGSVELLITIECRDRARTQDVTWIEQIATKRAHVGADRTVAVSSTAFSDAAITAAQAHGISVRVISEITDEDIRSLTDQLEVTVTTVTLELGRMALTYVETLAESPALAVQALELWNTQGWDARIFLEASSESPLSLTQLLSRTQAARSGQSPEDAVTITLQPKATVFLGDDPLSPHLRDVPADGTPIRKLFKIALDSENISVATSNGVRQLKQIAFEVTATSFVEHVPAKRIGQYATEQRVVARFVERQLQLGPNKSWNILSHQRTKSHKLS